MSVILAYTSPARGHLYPMMDVLIELQRRGHKVIVQTLADERDRVEEFGLEHRAIAPEIEALKLRDYEGPNPLSQFRIAVETWLERGPYELTDLRLAIDEIHPDFLLIDANTFGAAALAEASQIPWALHMPYCLPTASVDAPAFGPGFSPARNVLGRLRDTATRFATNQALAPQVRRLNAFRSESGAVPLKSLESLYAQPPIVLYRTAEPFEYARTDWASNVHPIGPGLFAPEAPIPDWFFELPKPRVLVSISTEAQNDGKIVQTAIDALGDDGGSLVCTTSAEDPSAFITDKPNVRVVRFLPHAQIMQHVDCVVTHGGMGTVQRALAAGVPLCVVPWGRDQSESAQRVVLAHAGTRLNPTKLNAERLKKAVQAATAQREGAQLIAAAFAIAGGASRAVDLIDTCLSA
jgi:MGT family glycosyltransferase